MCLEGGKNIEYVCPLFGEKLLSAVLMYPLKPVGKKETVFGSFACDK